MAADTTTQQQNLATEISTRAKALRDAMFGVDQIVSEINALGGAGFLTDAAFLGANSFMDGPAATSAITSFEAFQTLMSQGHNTNLAKVIGS